MIISKTIYDKCAEYNNVISKLNEYIPLVGLTTKDLINMRDRVSAVDHERLTYMWVLLVKNNVLSQEEIESDLDGVILKDWIPDNVRWLLIYKPELVKYFPLWKDHPVVYNNEYYRYYYKASVKNIFEENFNE